MTLQFYRADFNTIMSGLVVRYRVLGERESGEICAARNGVLVHGNLPTLQTSEDISAFAQVLWQCQRQYETLADGYGALSFDIDPDCVIEHRKYYFASEAYDVIATRQTQAEGGGR